MAKPATPEADLDQADPDAEVLDDGDPDEAGLDREDDTVEPSDGAEEDDEEKEDEEDEPPPAKKAGEGEEDDDEPDPDDVEADLDTILKDRIAANDDEDDDEDEEEEEVPTRTTEKPKEGPNRVTPRQPGEFVCTSCFLVKQRTQLADAANDLCDDCV